MDTDQPADDQPTSHERAMSSCDEQTRVQFERMLDEQGQSAPESHTLHATDQQLDQAPEFGASCGGGRGFWIHDPDEIDIGDWIAGDH
jgi:hypothetical protein